MSKMKNNNNTDENSTAEYWYKLAENYYNEGQKFIDNNEPQTRIDAAGTLAAKDFWIALCLGHERAAFSLYACFGQGIGVKQDNDIASFMFAIAQELRDPRTAGKTCQFSLPNSFKSKVYETSNLIKVTKSKIPAKGIDMGQVNDQMDIFDKVMTLPNGKSVFKIITTGNKSSENNEVFTTHNDHHNDHQHNQKSKVEKMGDKLEQCDIL